MITISGSAQYPGSRGAVETQLHRQLKERYCRDCAQMEVPVHGFRIDVVRHKELVEIQHGSLAAIRNKTATLLAAGYRILVVKPIITRKRLVRQSQLGGHILSERTSPKHGKLLDLFNDLVYFTRIYPHSRLAIEVPLIEVEERRYPGHGRRRRWKATDFEVEDLSLVRVERTERFATADDLLHLVSDRLPRPFNTADLARQLKIERWLAQRIAYCLRETGAVRVAGRKRSGWQYLPG